MFSLKWNVAKSRNVSFALNIIISQNNRNTKIEELPLVGVQFKEVIRVTQTLHWRQTCKVYGCLKSITRVKNIKTATYQFFVLLWVWKRSMRSITLHCFYANFFSIHCHWLPKAAEIIMPVARSLRENLFILWKNKINSGYVC